MKNKIIKRIEESKIIVIVRGVARENLLPLCEAMYKGGIRLVECTYDASGNTKDEEIAANIKMLSDHFGDKMFIGAGTVLTEKQVALTKDAGGTFIISPDTNPNIIRKSCEMELVSVPGAFSPSEISAANRYGADFVKVFPVNYMGSKYIKDLKAPLSHIKMLAVGGVTAENMGEYFAAGASGIGIGSGVVNKQLIAEGNFEEITNLAKRYTKNI